MSLKIIHEKLLKIKLESSKNGKVALLTEMLSNDAKFKLVVELTYDDTKHFNVNKLPPKQFHNQLLEKPSDKELFNCLDRMSKQKGASNEDKMELCRIASMDNETYDVVNRLIKGDLKCGFGGKSINKACPGLIFLMPYMRCSTEKAKIGNIDFSNGAIGQEKADGSFSNVIVDKDVLFRTRAGNEVFQLEHLSELLNEMPDDFRNTVYMGEVLVRIDGKILPRKTGNGILNKCMQNTCDPDIAKDVILKFWDAVPIKDFWEGKSQLTCKTRLRRVRNFLEKMSNIHPNNSLGLIESKEIRSLEEAKQFYHRLRSEGKEGAIIKNLEGVWKNHTSPDCIKLKNVIDFDLRVVDWKYGKPDTRFEEMMGAIICESECGQLRVSVGTGFSDEERAHNWDDEKGNIVTISCESIIKDKRDNKLHALYLPRFEELRRDRTEGQSLMDMQTR
jgi:hypothetical protein